MRKCGRWMQNVNEGQKNYWKDGGKNLKNECKNVGDE